jgi:hypothetical protein
LTLPPLLPELLSLADFIIATSLGSDSASSSIDGL